VARSQADRIIELEATCADFRREKDKVTDGYRRLVEKHRSLTERAEHEKTKLAEAHAAEVTKLRADLDLETWSYTKYHQTVRRCLRDLHEAVSSSFEEVKA
jgi:CRISPR/Cas system CMR-associated protein Cmr5 small subunit